MNRILLSISLVATILTSQNAFAWDSTTTGKIQGVEVWGNGNVRVWLVGQTSYCGAHNADSTWVTSGQQAVTPESLKTLTSILMSAWLAGKSITLYSNWDSTGAACRVGAITFTGV